MEAGRDGRSGDGADQAALGSGGSEADPGAAVAAGDLPGPRGAADAAAAAWNRVRSRLRREFGDEAFASWLNPMVLVSADGGEIVLGLPSRFMRDWVTNHFAERIKALWQVEWPATRTVALRVQPRTPAVAGPAARPSGLPAGLAPVPERPAPATAPAARGRLAVKPLGQAIPRMPGLPRPGGEALPRPRGWTAARGSDQPPPPPPPPRAAAEQAAAAQPEHGAPERGVGARSGAEATVPAVPRGEAEACVMGGTLDPRNTFDTFIVGRSNELAHAAARRVAEAERDRVPFNPLFLYGGVGLGKTHLMHAIAWHIRQRDPERKVMYLSAEMFMYQFITALRYKDTMAFKQQFRSVDVLMIDDVQFIAGKDSTQEEFFHTFNALCDQNRQIVISGDRSPVDLEGIEERMRSRLGWGLVADIHPTDYELRLSILQSKVEQLGIEVPRAVLEFLAHRITSNVRELEGALNRVAAFASLVGRPVDVEMAQEVLRDLLRANDRRITIEEIQKRVAEHFNIKLSEMHSARRAIAVARPRQVAMYLCKQLTTRSLPEIGRKFGNRDHTTVMHAVKRVEELQARDQELAEDIALLRRTLEG